MVSDIINFIKVLLIISGLLAIGFIILVILPIVVVHLLDKVIK